MAILKMIQTGQWYKRGCYEDAQFLNKIFSSDEDLFKLGVSINPHNFIYEVSNKLHVNQEHYHNLPEIIKLLLL